jgi:hypothetical protein
MTRLPQHNSGEKDRPETAANEREKTRVSSLVEASDGCEPGRLRVT